MGSRADPSLQLNYSACWSWCMCDCVNNLPRLNNFSSLYVAANWPGVELRTSWSRIWCPNHLAIKPQFGVVKAVKDLYTKCLSCCCSTVSKHWHVQLPHVYDTCMCLSWSRNTIPVVWYRCFLFVPDRHMYPLTDNGVHRALRFGVGTNVTDYRCNEIPEVGRLTGTASAGTWCHTLGMSTVPVNATAASWILSQAAVCHYYCCPSFQAISSVIFMSPIRAGLRLRSPRPKYFVGLPYTYSTNYNKQWII